MTDWLEELLEENEESLRWGWSVPGGGMAEEEEETVLPWTEEGRQGALDGVEAVITVRHGAETAREETAAERSTLPEWGSAHRRVLSGREGGSLGLYRRLVKMGRAVETARPQSRTAAAEHRSVGSPSLTVDALDRAVRRDSRRYDGAMELY